MLRLYDYAASANCYKARLLFALLDREYERVPIDIFDGDTLTEEYGRLNPLRETPVLELEDGRVIAQSNAILWYLAEGTAFLPGDPFERAAVVQWLSFEQEWVMGGVGSVRFRLLTGRELPPGRRETAATALATLDGHLRERELLVGEAPTIADLSNFAYARLAADADLDLGDYPGASAWIRRIEALPGFVDDLAPYPQNSRPGQGRSSYG